MYLSVVDFDCSWVVAVVKVGAVGCASVVFAAAVVVVVAAVVVASSFDAVAVGASYPAVSCSCCPWVAYLAYPAEGSCPLGLASFVVHP